MGFFQPSQGGADLGVIGGIVTGEFTLFVFQKNLAGRGNDFAAFIGECGVSGVT